MGALLCGICLGMLRLAASNPCALSPKDCALAFGMVAIPNARVQSTAVMLVVMT